jgi:zinc transport system substrate-binding protein
MRTILTRAIASGSLLAATACSPAPGTTGDRPVVVAGAWPIEVLLRAILPADADVVTLVPPGVEPHELELSADDLSVIDAAQAVIYVGGGFQPALEQVTDDGDIDVLTFAGDLLEAAEEGHADEGSEVHEGRVDPHVWLAPARWADVARGLGAQLVGRVEGTDVGGSAELLAGELEQLDEELTAGLRTCGRRTLFTEHEAFAYLADAYDLEQVALTGVSPEAEATAPQLERLVARARAEGATTVFAERGGEGRLAATLAREAGLELAALDPLEYAFEGTDETYADRMRANLAVLREALDCT